MARTAAPLGPDRRRLSSASLHLALLAPRCALFHAYALTPRILLLRVQVGRPVLLVAGQVPIQRVTWALRHARNVDREDASVDTFISIGFPRVETRGSLSTINRHIHIKKPFVAGGNRGVGPPRQTITD